MANWTEFYRTSEKDIENTKYGKFESVYTKTFKSNDQDDYIMETITRNGIIVFSMSYPRHDKYEYADARLAQAGYKA